MSLKTNSHILLYDRLIANTELIKSSIHCLNERRQLFEQRNCEYLEVEIAIRIDF